MDPLDAGENRADSLPRQGRPSLAIAPGWDDVLLNSVEVKEMWGLNERSLRTAIVDGRLRRVRRAGYQPYYPYSWVVAAFGAPKNPPPLGTVSRSERSKPA